MTTIPEIEHDVPLPESAGRSAATMDDLRALPVLIALMEEIADTLRKAPHPLPHKTLHLLLVQASAAVKTARKVLVVKAAQRDLTRLAARLARHWHDLLIHWSTAAHRFPLRLLDQLVEIVLKHGAASWGNGLTKAPGKGEAE